jgi:chemotaxis protein MotB
MNGADRFARGRARERRPLGQASWVTTFADMVTLLLTFLVLIFAVTNLDPRTSFRSPEGALREENNFVRLGNGVLLFSNQGLLAPVVKLAETLTRLPDAREIDQRAVTAALFQLEPAHTPDYERLRTAVDQGIKIFKDTRGLVIQWDRALLFPEGGATLYDDNQALLQKMAVFLMSLDLPVSVEGHTNPFSTLEGGRGPESFDLSFRRAKVIMKYLVSLGVPEKRFRLGAHGGLAPLTTDQNQAWQNSRLEIVVYRPDQGSLFGGRPAIK